MKNSISKIGILFITVFLFSVSNMKGQNREDGKHKEKPSYEHLLEKMDKNEDGKLSKKEVKGPLKDHFDEIDTNEDGYLSEKEFDKAPKPEGKKR